MSTYEDNNFMAIYIGSGLLYGLNEFAQDCTTIPEIFRPENLKNCSINPFNPYYLLPDSGQDFLLNYTSTFAGNITACCAVVGLATAPKFMNERHLSATFSTVTLATAVNSYTEYIDIEHNNQDTVDYGDVVAIGLALSCFTAVMISHIRKQRKREKALSL